MEEEIAVEFLKRILLMLQELQDKRRWISLIQHTSNHLVSKWKNIALCSIRMIPPICVGVEQA